MNDFLELFLQEVGERFEEMNRDFIELENNPEDEALLYSILRHMHSIKGSAGMFGFDNLKEMGHRLEDLMDIVHKDPSLVNRSVMDILFEGADVMQAAFRSISDNTPTAGHLSPRERTFLGRLDDLISELSTSSAGLEDTVCELVEELKVVLPGIASVFDTSKISGLIDNVSQILAISSPKVEVDPEEGPFYIGDTDVTSQIDVVFDLIGKANKSTLDATESGEFFKNLLFILDAIESANISDLADILSDAHESMQIFNELELDFDSLQSEYYFHIASSITPFLVTPSQAEETKVEIGEGALVKSSNEDTEDADLGSSIKKTVRIEEVKIDAFLEGVGEMIILGEVFNNLQKRFSDIIDNRYSGLVREFKSANSNFSQEIFCLQNALMDIRRVEIRNLTSTLSRLVRDTARTLDKRISLRISGGNAVVDKNLLDDVNTCLVHIVRNACDHGIESPDARQKAGKPSEGIISLDAYNEDDQLVIKISDDGQGISLEKIREKAVSLGLRSASDAAALSERNLLELLYEDGFTTTSAVSDISGRGVGMSAVVECIQKNGGSIEIKTNEGLGTEVLIRIPLSIMLSVLDGLVFKSASESFIIPIRYVAESLNLSDGILSTYQGKGTCVSLRDEIYPVVKLSEVLNIPAGNEEIGIIISNDKCCYCLVVDEIIDHQQVVVKRIGGLDNIQGIMGGALLGDGAIGLVINVDTLYCPDN